MHITTSAESIEIHFDLKQLTHLQRLALDWLAADPVLEARRVGERLEVGLEWWHQAGEVPSDDAPEEEKDAWAYRHATLACFLGTTQQSVMVDATGYLGGPDFRMHLVVDRCEVDSHTESPMAGATLMLPAVYRAQRMLSRTRTPWPRGSQLAALGQLRDQLISAERLLSNSPLSIAVRFHPHLADVSLKRASKGKLGWAPSPTVDGLYSLQLEVESDGQNLVVDVGQLDPDAPLLSASSKEHILLSPELEETARAVKGRRDVPRRRLELDPLAVLPEGHEYGGLDLSEYSSRVVGFGPIERPESEGRSSSGVQWYQRDDEPAASERIELHVQASSGEEQSITIPQSSVTELLERARQARDAGTEVEVAGHHFSPDALLPALERHAPLGNGVLRDGQADEDRGADPSPKRARANEAAIIAESEDAGGGLGIIDFSPVPWGLLDEMLTPNFSPKEHQRQGIAWLWNHSRAGSSGVLLADEMGLGKTFQLACFLALKWRCGSDEDRSRPSLIVSPLILVDNWQRELTRYFRPGAVPKQHVARSELLRAGGLELLADGPRWIIMAYDALARRQKDILRIDFDTTILDESQQIKNPGTYRTAAARALKRSFGICSTGTPIENRLRDLWTQFDFLSPGRPLPASPKAFCEEFEGTADGAKRLRQVLAFPSWDSPVLHRTKDETLRDLPRCTTHPHPIPMTTTQVETEQQIVREKGQALAILGNLQKLYQHPSLLLADPQPEVDDAIAQSPKLERCLQLLEDIRQKDEKAIVFVLYTRMQELLKRVIHEKLGLFPVRVVNGDSNQKKKSQGLIDEFSSRQGFNVLILSPLAAGAGLNITAANHVIHYGRWWNPAREDQATARAHRIGQTKDVYVHHLVMHHPHDPAMGFDVKLHDYVESKRGMAADFLAPIDSSVGERALADLMRGDA